MFRDFVVKIQYTSVRNKDIDLPSILFKLVGKCNNRSKIVEINQPKLSILISSRFFDDYEKKPVSRAADSLFLNLVLFRAFSPFSLLRHAIISLAGFMEAKCLEASKPTPAFAPVTTTVLLVKSAFTTGAMGRNEVRTRSK
jgi:hypothetical protein